MQSGWSTRPARTALPGRGGHTPDPLFDTELAGRLLNYPTCAGPSRRTVLGTAREEHPAADWSPRRLPQPCATPLYTWSSSRATRARPVDSRAGKLGWAREEFAALATFQPPGPRDEPLTRRTSGCPGSRRRRLPRPRAVVRARPAGPSPRPPVPGQVLPDAAIVEERPWQCRRAAELAVLPVFRGRAQRRESVRWAKAIARGRARPPSLAVALRGYPGLILGVPGPAALPTHRRPCGARRRRGTGCRSRTCWPGDSAPRGAGPPPRRGRHSRCLPRPGRP